MLEVKPNKEILKIKNTMYLGFTGFQAAMLILGLFVGALLFVVLPFHDMINVMILSIVVCAFVTLGIIRINNMDLFTYLTFVIKDKKIGRQPWFFEKREEDKY